MEPFRPYLQLSGSVTKKCHQFLYQVNTFIILHTFCLLKNVSMTCGLNKVYMETEMATHSSVLAWRIPGTGSHRVGHD